MNDAVMRGCSDCALRWRGLLAFRRLTPPN
jgi:hypothetical protein